MYKDTCLSKTGMENQRIGIFHRRNGIFLVDIGHAHQWFVQFLYILGIQFDGELVTGENGLSGRRDVFTVAVDIYDYAMVGKFESVDLFAIKKAPAITSTSKVSRFCSLKTGLLIISS